MAVVVWQYFSSSIIPAQKPKKMNYKRTGFEPVQTVETGLSSRPDRLNRFRFQTGKNEPVQVLDRTANQTGETRPNRCYL